MTLPIPFDNSYARLPDALYQRVAPTPVKAPALLRVNDGLARQLGIDPAYLASPEGVAVLAGNAIAPGSEPLALAYAGHQFGNFVPQLGDGRAVLLGEVVDPEGQRHDLQLKGSGRTRFSRRGDGRAALGPVLREYIVSEAMAALGIPTTRTLAAVSTGEEVERERMLPGACLARVAASHMRVGTLEYFAARDDVMNLRVLADYAIARHYPQAGEAAQPYQAFLDMVIARLAQLAARWMLVGFIHGVLNTDNMSIAGETIDYGPCAFMDAYNPAQVYSAIDQYGRYAYGNQPMIVKWNVARLAEALLPLLAEDADAAVATANAAVARFNAHYYEAFNAGMREKLGLAGEVEGDAELGADLLDIMAAQKADFTLTFRALAGAAESGEDHAVRALFADTSGLDAWLPRWRQRLAPQATGSMRAANPLFIPRNHRIAEVIAAAEAGDLGPFHQLVDVLANPYELQPAYAAYASPPLPEEEVRQTFCGT